MGPLRNILCRPELFEKSTSALKLGSMVPYRGQVAFPPGKVKIDTVKSMSNPLRAIGGMGYGLFFVPLGVECAEASRAWRRRVREVFVGLESNGNAYFRFAACGTRPNYTKYPSAAAYGHAFTQRDL